MYACSFKHFAAFPVFANLLQALAHEYPSVPLPRGVEFIVECIHVLHFLIAFNSIFPFNVINFVGVITAY